MHNKPSLLPLFNAKVGNQTTIRWFESDKRLKIGKSFVQRLSRFSFSTILPKKHTKNQKSRSPL